MVHVKICYFGQVSMVEMIDNYKAQYYVDLLEQKLLYLVSFFANNPSVIFKQDNTSIHSVQTVKDYFQSKNTKCFKLTFHIAIFESG